MAYFFQNLLTASFHGSVIIAAVLLLRTILKKAPKRAICLLWMLAFIRLLMPFQLESQLSLQPEAIPLEEAPFYEAVFEPDTDEDRLAADAIINNTAPIVPALPEGIAGNMGGEIHYEEQPAPEAPTVFRWSQLLPIIWALGAALMLLYAFGSYVHLKLTVREAVKVIGGWECDRIETAFILGYIRPRIYVPMGLSRRTRKHILSHEWAHLKSGDHWFKLLAYLALCLHWFNPLAWVAYRLMCKDMEHACDEQVIRYMDLNERKQYSHALLTCSTNRSHYTPCPVAFGEVSVKSRILSVLNYRKPSFWITLIAVIAIGCVCVFLMTSPESSEINDTNTPDVSTTDDILHDVEIDEVVSYTAPTYPDATEVYTAASINDFLGALGSDRIIELTPGDFELWKASTYNTDEDTGKFYYWNTEYGRNELVIRNVENLVIRSSGRDHTEFLSENLASDVLKFENCSRIALEGFTAGHKKLPDSCAGGVIGLEECADVTMDKLGLYGCGAVGIISRTCDRMVVTNADIYDCSGYGVNLWDTNSARFEDCRFYRIGNRAPDKHGRTVIHLENCKAVEFYASTITDSYVYNLITEYNTEAMDLSQLHFKNNTALNAMLDFHNSRHPVVMDKCTFKDNTYVNWYGVEQVAAVNRKGEKLTAEQLDTEEITIEPEFPPMTEVRVSNVDQFLKAIAPNTAIILEEGEYDLSKAKDYGKGSSDYYSWYEGPDGPELYINNVSNFSITGQGQDKTTISAVPRHANVLNFTACSNITIFGLTAGHTREPGVCSGGVLNFNASSQIDIYGCGLYGCGVYGVTTHNVEQILIASCEIYECSQGGVRMGNTNGITIKNTVFRDLGGTALKYDGICNGVVLEGNTLPEELLAITPLNPADKTSFALSYEGTRINNFEDVVGTEIVLTVENVPEGATVTATNSDPDVVYLDYKDSSKTAVIRIKAEGRSVLTFSCTDKDNNKQKFAFEVRGTNELQSAELRYANSPLAEFTEAIGHNVKLTLHYEPKDSPVTDADVRWISADNSVASVRGDTKGCTITCEGEGNTTITCELFGKPVCSVRVYVRESW